MRALFVFALCGLSLASCKKDDEPPVDCSPTPDFFQLKVGNYWIYEHIRVDTFGVETDLDQQDSMIISGTEIIDGEEYFVFVGINYPFTQQVDTLATLRDSAGYLVGPYGGIAFAPNNFSDTLYQWVEVLAGDTLYERYDYMVDLPDPITVPAGTFDVQSLASAFISDLGPPNLPKPRLSYKHYADGVGKVMQTYFYTASPDVIEIRLVRYHLEP